MLNLKECNLRLISEEDLEQILEWRNTERVRAAMYTDQIITKEEHYVWFERVSNSDRSKHLIFAYSGRPIGVVNVTDIDRNNGKCYWGFYIGATDTPVGMGLAMGYFGLNYIFEILGIRKLCSEALGFNAASIGYHETLGFTPEGHFKQHVLKQGQYQDIVCLALFREQWFAVRNHIYKRCFGDERNL